ncbi:dipeptide epimerase [Streptomyces verrucosisporus]|uniref:dipeptide epimerase n=1 Tax=Streptomyces verrucosisporus TaxID=1695161 RepID=UPI0019D05EF4|nr:dipeptide epimerase [Streptomyces verrucosisporus]MBN3931203.1 dipeptide epimerase [Streptomyces verrucosisporus]
MRLTVRTVSLELARPLRISRSVMARRDAVWARIEHEGTTGHGEVVSSVYLDLTAERAARALLDRAAPALARHPGPESALVDLREGTLLPPGLPPGVTAAVDSALLDLLGRSTGRPVHRLLPGQGVRCAPPAAATARTIGITPPADAAVQARDLTARGFRLLKIKAGAADPAEDLDRVAAVRDAAPGVRILLDPNGAWEPEQARELLPRFAALGVEAVEQPTVPGDPETLARLAERSPLPLIADEDATGYDDALRLAGRVQGVNVKLAKCGGVHQALRIIDALDGSGTDVMLGCLTASSLGIAPAVHLADRARWADLDGHLLLAHDPWQGIGGADGTVRATGLPGLGVTPAPTPAPAALPPGKDTV